MKNLRLALCVLCLLAGCRVTVRQDLRRLVIAPVVLQTSRDAVSGRLDILKKCGFNTIVFLNAAQDQWPALVQQAHERALLALFMVNETNPTTLRHIIMQAGVQAKIDGIWLSQGQNLSPRDIKYIQKSLKTPQKAIKSPCPLGALFLQSEENAMPSFFHTKHKFLSVICFDHNAAGVLGLSTTLNPAGDAPASFVATLNTMLNWHKLYAQRATLLVPLAQNFSHAYTQPAIFPLMLTWMASVSGPVYLPIALNENDALMYHDDMTILQRVLALRAHYPALWKGSNQVMGHHNGVYIAVKKHNAQTIVITCNFNQTPQRYRMPYLSRSHIKGKTLHNIFDQRTVSLQSKTLEWNLKPFEVGIWIVK